MKTNQSLLKRTLRILSFVALLVFFACSKEELTLDDGTVPQFSNNDASDFDAAIANLSFFVQPEESDIEPNGTEETTRAGDTEYACTTQNYKGAPGYNELFMLDPTTDVIYPGSMLKGESIPSGEYIRINEDRAPITISTSFSNIDGKPSVTIENPNLISNVRAGIQELLNREVNGSTAAQLISDEYEVYSEEHVSIALAANYRSRAKEISGNFDFSSSSVKRKYVLKFVQKYFTLDLDSPGKLPSDLFTSLPSIESLGSTSPVYVSSVTYGRMVLYTVESQASLTEVKAAFEAAYNIGKNEGGASLEGAYKSLFQESNVKVIIVGGDGNSAAQAVAGIADNPTQIYDFIAEGGNYSKDSPGAPISYKLSYVKEGFPTAKVVLSTEYQARNCDLAYPEYEITIVDLNVTNTPGFPSNEGDHLEIWGSVEGELKKDGQRVGSRVRWVRASDNDLQINISKNHPIGQKLTVEVERPDYDVDYIEIKGDLNDKDSFSSQNLGVRSYKIFLKDLVLNDSYTHTLVFDEVAYHEVKATFLIERTK
ncbi:thiol-activated cytolysin family protein [Eudoraea chungangensis]|uniref:thiol-activated cytolysin family protein n=1 Tax=Eudoraea chungangensis TaxID=1481905 RepID=UPI0023EC29B8|nr:thiol-activated cytolysin family protein [Eudoraea chungangensis]